jgi:hypothetical protein
MKLEWCLQEFTIQGTVFTIFVNQKDLVIVSLFPIISGIIITILIVFIYLGRI